MTHFQQTFHIIERPSEAETLGQRTSEVDTKHIVLNDNKPASVNESDSGFAAAAALQAISSGLQCGEPPLQFSEGIHIAHQQFGNRAVLQFVTQQIRLHDRDSSYIHDIARAGTQGAGRKLPVSGTYPTGLWRSRPQWSAGAHRDGGSHCQCYAGVKRLPQRGRRGVWFDADAGDSGP